MNEKILNKEVQDYISEHLKADVNKIALAKSLFKDISSAELAGQIAAKKKAIHKLPTWFKTANCYYPPLLSIEQCSSEQTAAYKANLAKGNHLIDLTAGFGVDSYFFAQKVDQVLSCEINPELANINAYNAKLLQAKNIQVIAADGVAHLQNSTEKFSTIYIDPARRNKSAKVFMLKDCVPDVSSHLTLFLAHADRIIIKTAPLLDITAGLGELTNVSEIHILSVKNECKELLWVIDKQQDNSEPIIYCATINEQLKVCSFPLNAVSAKANPSKEMPVGYLYEPDVALLKSGAFNFIANHYGLQKLHQHSHLYFAPQINSDFLGRIFEIERVLSLNELKKETKLIGNVIVRNFPEKAEFLAKKYKITPHHDHFIIFTQNFKGNLAIKAKIIQHY